jgi:hypothetical protein
MKEALSAAQEALAQELAGALAQAIQTDLLQIARPRVATDPASLFGDTEVAVRDLVRNIGAKAYQHHLGQKKPATTDPA